VSNARRYYDALRKIAIDYRTVEQLRRDAGQHGCTFEDVIEMSYDNMQEVAKVAIRGRRRPDPDTKKKKP